MVDLSSPAFAMNERIPKKHTGEGEDISPPLSWGEIPPETKELAIICDDPDAPSPEPWVHWIIYKIPPGTAQLPAGLPRDNSLSEPYGALQGKNSWGTVGYRGPLPPPGHGEHRYFFTLYMLDKKLDVTPGLNKRALLSAMKGHVLSESSVIGLYSR